MWLGEALLSTALAMLSRLALAQTPAMTYSSECDTYSELFLVTILPVLDDGSASGHLNCRQMKPGSIERGGRPGSLWHPGQLLVHAIDANRMTMGS